MPYADPTKQRESNRERMRRFRAKRQLDPVAQEKLRAYKRSAYAANPEPHRQRQREYYWENREDCLSRSSQYAQALRQEALDHYGRTCACCGETEDAFLQIDHIAGNGNEHRRQIRTTIFLWLKQNGYPTGFQTLCANCNLAKYQRGTCPHQVALVESGA